MSNRKSKSEGARHKPNRPQPVKGYLAGILPQDFRHKQAEIGHYQQFFQSLSSDPVYQSVRVLNVSNDEISLALPSPALANYLRLHSVEIRQLLIDQFGHDLKLRIQARPVDTAYPRSASRLPPAEHFPAKVCDQVRASAAGLEDEDLKQALLSLADRMQTDPDASA